jgi:hypothetical protein
VVIRAASLSVCPDFCPSYNSTNIGGIGLTGVLIFLQSVNKFGCGGAGGVVGKAEPFPALRRVSANCPQIHGHSGLPLVAPRLRRHDPSVPAQRFDPSVTPLLKNGVPSMV